MIIIVAKHLVELAECISITLLLVNNRVRAHW